MKLAISISPTGVIRVLTVVVFCLTLAGIAAFTFKRLDFPFPASKWFYKQFNIDAELNVPAWYSTFALLFSSGLLAIIAAVKKQECDRYFSQWKVLSLIFLFFSIDEALGIHELFIIPSLRKTLNLSAIFYQTWVIIGAVLVGIFVVKYQKFLRHLPEKTRFLFSLAGSFYVGGALGMEMVGGVLTKLYGRTSVQLAIAIVTEEFLEMVGVLVFIYALMTYISSLTETLDIKVSFLNPQKKLDKVR